MVKRKNPTASPKTDENGMHAAKPDASPPPAKKIGISSTSKQGEGHVSSYIAWPVDHGSPSEAPVSPSGYFCSCCNFSTYKRSMLKEHLKQHKLKCPWCPFSSLTHQEVIHHCKFNHGESAEMDSDPCHACVLCDFMTYIMVCLENHIALKHPGEPVKYIPILISKQVSAGVRRDDAVLSKSLHNENDRFALMEIEAGSQSGAQSTLILKDSALEVLKNIKQEANSDSVSEKCVKTADLSTDSVNKQLSDSYIFSDTEESKDLKSECGSVETNLEVRVAKAPCVEVKLEKLFCLTCPFNCVSIDEVKSHTESQHPVAPAAATYNSKGESVTVNDTTFFCVRKSCTFSSFNYVNYQKHLIECCARLKTLTVLESMRLKYTIQHILDCQKMYGQKLCLDNDFRRFASLCLSISVPTYQVFVSTAGTLWSQSSLPSSNEHVNKSSVVSSDHSSSPVTTCNDISPHNPQTASAGMQLTSSQQGNIQSQYPTYLGTTPRMQCNPGVPNSHATSPALEDNRGQFVRILDTFSLRNTSSNAPYYSSHASSNVPLNSDSALSNVSIKASNLPSNVQNILKNMFSNSPINSRHAPSIGNEPLQQPNQIPGKSLSSFLPDQNGNEKQRAAFYTGHIKQGTERRAHNFLMGTNLVSLASQHQPRVLVGSSLWHVKVGNQIQPSVSVNSPAHINHGTGNIPHNLPLNTTPVYHTGQHRPGILNNSNQHHGSVSGNFCTSAAGRPNTQGQKIVGSTYQTLQDSQSHPIANGMVSGHPSGIFTTTDPDTAVGVMHVSPASQLNTVRGSGVFEQESGNLMAIGLNQGTIGNMNHTFPASQCNTIDGRTVFGQQSGSLTTAGHNQGGYHTASQYNTIAGGAIPVGHSDILTSTGFKQYTPGNQTYSAQADKPDTSLGYCQEPLNFTTVSLSHSVTVSQNQTTPIDASSPVVMEETYQKQQCNINPNGLGSSTQEDTLSPNTTLVYDMSSESRPHELAYSNPSQSPSASFHQTESLNSQNQTMIQNIPLAKPAEQSGIDSQTGTPKMQPAARCPSSEQNSGGQFSSRSEHVGSYSGLQTADDAGNNRSMCSALSEQPSNIHVEPGAIAASPVLSLEADSLHPSHLNQATHALSSVSVHNGSRMAESPQQANSVSPVKMTSRSPSKHRQSPEAAITYTKPKGAAQTEIRPRRSCALGASQSNQSGQALTGIRPKRLRELVASQSNQSRQALTCIRPKRSRELVASQSNQRRAALTGIRLRSSRALVASQSNQRRESCRRQISRGRGQARSPRMASGGTTGSNNPANCSGGIEDDDDDKDDDDDDDDDDYDGDDDDDDRDDDHDDDHDE